MNKSILAELFDILDMAVIEYRDDGSLTPLSPLTPWLRGVFPCTELRKQYQINVDELSYLGNFLVDAQGLWSSGSTGRILWSSVWMETIESGKCVTLKVGAARIENKRILILKMINQDEFDEQGIFQIARENELSIEDLSRTEHDLEILRNNLETEVAKARTKAEETSNLYLDLFDFAPLGYFTLDEHSRIAEVNLTGCRLLQVDRGKLLNKHFTGFIPPDETDSFYQNRQTALENSGMHSFEVKMRKADGTWFYAQLDTIGVGQDGLRITVSDITERKLQEKLLQDALEEKDVLLREITHRVKNNLAAVIGLMNMRARSSSNPAVQGMVQDLTGHIRSMALAHEMLLHSGTYKYIKMDNYLETLLADVPRFFEREHPVTVKVKVDDTRLDMDTAVPVGMLASELVTNALKHAFPESKNHLDGDECAISVSLKQSDGRVLLEVSDNGVGLPRGFDLKNTSSMGMHLLHMLGEHQLRGIIEINSTHGTTFKLNFPYELRNSREGAAGE